MLAVHEHEAMERMALLSIEAPEALPFLRLSLTTTRKVHVDA